MRIDYAVLVGDYRQLSNRSYDLLRVPQNVVIVSGLGRLLVHLYVITSFDESELGRPSALAIRIIGPDIDEVGRLQSAVTGHRHPNLPPGWTVTNHRVFDLDFAVRRLGAYSIDLKSAEDEISVPLLIRGASSRRDSVPAARLCASGRRPSALAVGCSEVQASLLDCWWVGPDGRACHFRATLSGDHRSAAVLKGSEKSPSSRANAKRPRLRRCRHRLCKAGVAGSSPVVSTRLSDGDQASLRCVPRALHHPSGESPTLLFQRDLDLAAHLDRLGLDEFWCGEHHSSGWETIASPEMFLAAAGQVTHRILLGTGVVSLPYHHPFNVAQRMAQLDHMTRGRAMFGSGPGALPSDVRTHGIDPVLFGADRQDEALGIIIRLLRGEDRFTYECDWFELHDAQLQILPLQDAMPMATASSISPSGMQLAGKYGIGVLSIASRIDRRASRRCRHSGRSPRKPRGCTGRAWTGRSGGC